jgi:hypothetical protein
MSIHRPLSRRGGNLPKGAQQLSHQREQGQLSKRSSCMGNVYTDPVNVSASSLVVGLDVLRLCMNSKVRSGSSSSSQHDEEEEEEEKEKEKDHRTTTEDDRTGWMGSDGGHTTRVRTWIGGGRAYLCVTTTHEHSQRTGLLVSKLQTASSVHDASALQHRGHMAVSLGAAEPVVSDDAFPILHPMLHPMNTSYLWLTLLPAELDEISRAAEPAAWEKINFANKGDGDVGPFQPSSTIYYHMLYTISRCADRFPVAGRACTILCMGVRLRGGVRKAVFSHV